MEVIVIVLIQLGYNLLTESNMQKNSICFFNTLLGDKIIRAALKK